MATGVVDTVSLAHLGLLVRMLDCVKIGKKAGTRWIYIQRRYICGGRSECIEDIVKAL